LFPLLAQTTPFGSKPISAKNNPIVTRNNVLKNTTAAKVECDPTTDTGNEPDIGVLSCSNEYYCMESPESSLGGYCVAKDEQQYTKQQRSLQVVGNRTVFELVYDLCFTDSFIYYTCDCNINNETSTGTFNCIGQKRCAYLYTGCTGADSTTVGGSGTGGIGENNVRFQYCLEGTVSGKLDGPASYSYTTW
jgi:hypothetical protein